MEGSCGGFANGGATVVAKAVLKATNDCDCGSELW